MLIMKKFLTNSLSEENIYGSSTCLCFENTWLHMNYTWHYTTEGMNNEYLRI